MTKAIEVSVKDAESFTNALNRLKDVGITGADKTVFFNLAFNKKALSELVDALELKKREVLNREYSDYTEKLQILNIEYQDNTGGFKNPAEFAEKFRLLRAEYGSVIKEHDKSMNDIRSFLLEKRTVELRMVSPDSIKVDENNAAAVEVLSNLLLCIEFSNYINQDN